MLIFLVAEFSLAHFKAIFGHIGASASFLEGIGKNKVWQIMVKFW